MNRLRTVSRYFIYAVLCAALLSCSDAVTKKAEQLTVVEHKNKVDTVVHKSISAEPYFDSGLYYFQMQMDYNLKRDDAEIKYIRTENDWYRVEGNRYADSSHFYSNKLQRLAARR